jgi:hypothetical protein
METIALPGSVAPACATLNSLSLFGGNEFIAGMAQHYPSVGCKFVLMPGGGEYFALQRLDAEGNGYGPRTVIDAYGRDSMHRAVMAAEFIDAGLPEYAARTFRNW